MKNQKNNKLNIIPLLKEIFKNIENKSIKILSLIFIIILITSKYTNTKIKSNQISFNSSIKSNKQNAIKIFC